MISLLSNFSLSSAQTFLDSRRFLESKKFPFSLSRIGFKTTTSTSSPMFTTSVNSLNGFAESSRRGITPSKPPLSLIETRTWLSSKAKTSPFTTSPGLMSKTLSKASSIVCNCWFSTVSVIYQFLLRQYSSVVQKIFTICEPT